MLIFPIVLCSTAPPPTDQERLARAVDYFQSGKYHEALLLFDKLDKVYQLNPRFQAYNGVCNFYDRNYKKAAEILDSIMPKLDKFAPHERSIYYYCAAESHYQLSNYHKAITYFENQLLLCYDNEKGDSLFRIGLCYIGLKNILTAQEYLKQAVAYYRRFNDESKMQMVEKEMTRIENK